MCQAHDSASLPSVVIRSSTSPSSQLQWLREAEREDGSFSGLQQVGVSPPTTEERAAKLNSDPSFAFLTLQDTQCSGRVAIHHCNKKETSLHTLVPGECHPLAASKADNEANAVIDVPDTPCVALGLPNPGVLCWKLPSFIPKAVPLTG